MPTMFPYPGLRPFQSDEADIFFGREVQTDELLRKLSETRFLGVVGPSGCGKSSLVKAGMIPALETGFMVTAGTRWRIATMRPGSHPLRRLAEALMDQAALGAERTADYALPLLEAVLRRGPRALVDALIETPLPSDTNLLVLVDQFEELFRFRNEENRNDQDAFVPLLLETAAQHGVPVYVVVTMRSDYLGDCALFPGLPEALNKSQYLTPRMNREQRQAAITGPARVFGGDVEPSLVNRLLNETGTDPNQLPVLQHLLMRMWACSRPTRPVTPNAVFFADIPSERLGHVLSDQDYEEVGGIAGALSIHADQAFNSLQDEQKPIAEILFRSLCERGTERRDGRCPTAVREIADRAGVSPDRVKAVVTVFRDTDYGFLVPAPPEEIFENTVIDITHESLIRLWRRLNAWVEEEAKSAETYRFVEQSARRWKEKQAALWGTPNLEIAMAWKQREKPSRPWAERYGGNFELAMEFLEASAEEQRRQQARAHKEYLRKLRRARLLAVSFGTAALLLICGILLLGYLKDWDYVKYYNSFMKVSGEPKGVGELTLTQVQHRPVSIKIIRKGRWGRALRMEAINSKGELTALHNIGTYLESSEESIPNEVAWEFNYDASGHVSYETALDYQENRVWGFVYLPPPPGLVGFRTGYFVDANGYPRKDKKYAESFIEIEYRDTEKGIEEYRRYRNRGNQAIRGPDKAFGQLRRYDKKGRWLEKTSLGPNDKYMNDEAGNATFSVTKLDSLGNAREQVALDASGMKVTVKDGYSIIRSEYDENGNAIEDAYFDLSEQPTLHVKGYHKIKWERDRQGNIIKEIYLDTADKPTVGDRGCYSLRLEYDTQNNPIKEFCLGPDQKLTANTSGFAVWKGKYDGRSKKLAETSYHDTAERLTQSSDGYARATYRYNDSGKLVETAYFGPDSSPVCIRKGYARLLREYNDNGQLVSVAYFGTKGEPIASDQGYARWDQEFDNYGNVLHVSYYGPDEKRIVSIQGYTGWSAKYDASGNEIETVYLNAEDEPVIGKDGYAGWRSEYDMAGNERKRTYIGLRGEQTLSSDGVAGFTSTFDSLGNETARRHFGLDGKPVMHRKGYSSWIASYDAHGNIEKMRYLDINDEPALVPWEDASDKKSPGYSSWRKQFNPQNRPIEEEYFGIHDEPVLHKEGWARANHEYDPRGNKVKSAYFGVYGERVLINQGYHSVKRRYNDQGNVVEINYYYVDGSPVASEEGFARLVKKYDPFGRLTEQFLYDAEGKPTAMKDEGFHRTVRRHDDRGRVIEDAYFGTDGPILHRDGYHKIRYKYDDLGNEIERAYQGVDGMPVTNKVTGYATERMKYDAKGNILEIAYFDVDGEPTNSDEGFAKMILTYNVFGKITSNSYFSVQEKLTQNVLGYAESRMEYNAQGKVIYQVYLGTMGKPVLIPRQKENQEWGYASYRANYDSHGNLTEIAYFGKDDEPIATKNGYHRLKQKFNSRRQIVEQMTFDVEDRPVMNVWKYARLLRKYDDRGNLTEISAFDEKGQPSEVHYGYARMSMKYDSRGNLIEEAYFGSDLRPKILPDFGCARHTYKYDSDGNKIEDACYGSDNALYNGFLGDYARLTMKYDARRRVIEERYFGPNGKPIRLSGFNQHITRFLYDSAGNKIEERYLGIHEEPVLGISLDGEYCTRWTAKYDLAKKLIDKKCHQK